MASVTFPSPAWLKDFHEKDIFTHHSYYKVVRHNHNPHVIGALARLGATEEQVKDYMDTLYKYIPEYKENEPLTEVMEVDTTKSDNLIDYRGKHNGMYKMKQLYEELLKTKYNGDMLAMVKDVCPDVIDGPLYSAFHGIITLAYGYVAKSDSVMLEGLIFMDQQYAPMLPTSNPKYRDVSKFGTGKTSMLDVLKKLHDNQDLVKQVKQDDKAGLADGTKIKGAYGWPLVAHHGEYMTEMTDEIQLPEWFDQSKEDMQQISDLIDWFFDMSTVAYVKNENINDFFILHSLTGSWAAKQILPLFDYKTALLGLRGLISAVLATFVNQNAPALTRTPEDFFKGEVTEELWQNLIKSVLGELPGKKYEMHVYKVIQASYENWKQRPNSEYASYYYAAALSARNQDYYFSTEKVFPNADLSF